jgi:hypothetical protein
MENEKYFLSQTLLENKSNKPLLIRSPDFPEINNQSLPVGFSGIMQFVYPIDLKLRKDSWINNKGIPVVYLELVDKDF